MSIPVIDLSNPDVARLARQVKDACVDWGFMYLKNHGVSRSTIDRTFEISKEFFHTVPLEIKQAYPRGGLDHGSIGYTGQFTERLDLAKQKRGDLKETWNMSCFADKNYKQTMPDMIMSRWDEILQFQRECFAVEQKLAPDYFAKFHNAKEDIMRFTSYTPPDFPLIENDMGAGAHSDFGSLTLLFQDDVGGLQVLSNGEWLDAKPIPDTILVNVADAMQFWTSQILRSTKHRVTVPSKQRYSLVYFVVADPETPLKPIHQAGEEKAMTAKEHLQMQIDIVMGFRPPPAEVAATA